MHRSLFSASSTCIPVSQSCLFVLQWSTPPLPFSLNHLLRTSIWPYLGGNNSSAKRVPTSPILYLTPACLSVCLYRSLPACLPHAAPQSPLTREKPSGTHAHRQGCNAGAAPKPLGKSLTQSRIHRDTTPLQQPVPCPRSAIFQTSLFPPGNLAWPINSADTIRALREHDMCAAMTRGSLHVLVS
jgi:hypothetical protein